MSSVMDTGAVTIGGVAVLPPANTGRHRVAALLGKVEPSYVVLTILLILYPWVASPFFTFQIGGQSLALGIIALSLAFLAGYGGMVSRAQMTLAESPATWWQFSRQR
jgi:branched-chain amino acid transport system permease protein